MSWLPSPEYADWWYDTSWKGLIAFGALAAFATAATVVFTMLQFWSDGVRDRKAEERTVALEIRASDANREAAEANARAAEANLALAKLKAARTISVAQERDLVARMSAWSVLPKSKEPQRVAVFSVSDTFESKQLADLIAEILGPGGAKWAINRYPVMYGKSYSVVGIGLLIPSTSKRARAIAISLADALTEYGLLTSILERQGLSTEGDEDASSGLSAISVMVGEKPNQ